MLEQRHLTHFHWDLDPQEWKHNNTQKAIDYVEKQVGAMTGRNVLLMHDIKKATVEGAAGDPRLDRHRERRARGEPQAPDPDHPELGARGSAASGSASPAWIRDATPDPFAWGSALANVLPVMTASEDVLIVGAGPTGLVLALWLAKLGVRARIVDKATAAAARRRARSRSRPARSSSTSRSGSPTRSSPRA